MQKAQLRFDEGFAVALMSRRAQVATLTLAPGGSTGGPDNRHQGADQWLYVVSGEGVAAVDGTDHVLGPGMVMQIEHGESHEIRCAGTAPLQILNFYEPPAFSPSGEPLPAGESG